MVLIVIITTITIIIIIIIIIIMTIILERFTPRLEEMGIGRIENEEDICAVALA